MSRTSWKIVADENIPFVVELFEVFGEVSLLDGRSLNPEDLHEADILLVRSVTKVNRQLLEHSNVKFVGTCTIGLDHLDIPWLESRGIAWASAPGCNAWGVVQYVLSAMAIFDLLRASTRVGIVGCGNVGGRLHRTLVSLGMECVCVDPFLDKRQNPDLAPFEKIYQCDLVSVHTPLTYTGEHPTHHLFNAETFPALKPASVLLNAGRGSVINNQALLNFLDKGGDLRVVLDVWETEPDIDSGLLEKVKLASPHIAGYSYEGRVNGSLMIFDALLNFLNDSSPLMLDHKKSLIAKVFGEPELLRAHSLTEAILASYDIGKDDKALRSITEGLPEGFDKLRKTYRKRREPSHYVLEKDGQINDVHARALGFGLAN